MSKTLYRRENELFREQLRRARETAGLTQADLARAIGRTQVFVSHVERGVRRLDAVELLEICRAMGVDLTTFVSEFQKTVDALPRRKTSQVRRTGIPRPRG
ncbi:XRE family transcriptional regulator [Luteimonas aestuarii]|uniref:XRE family transcriptional regulator n=1 Tax=Luteimonas aestuarii TaxID=453837 RepID=A0A4R5TYR3_9GAMM|nr:helix-turn-helix transcriptional regulator [Luteimonas aestuarii]TDK26311.1 XRE family transcriptional regulator [Luteimonas aestuarii]